MISNCKGDVMEWLKGSYPREDVSDLAGRLVAKEIIELRGRYPLLKSSKNVRKQVVENVRNRLVLIYPFLAERSPPRSGWE